MRRSAPPTNSSGIQRRPWNLPLHLWKQRASLLEENGSVSEDTLDSIRQVIGSLESSAGSIREVPALDSGRYTEEARQIYTAASSGLETLNNTLEDASVKLEGTASTLEKRCRLSPVHIRR